MRRDQSSGLTDLTCQACSRCRTISARAIELVTRDNHTSFGVWRINILSFSKHSLREVGRGQVFTVNNVDEIRKREENDEEKPET